jgi:threonine dehydrogenase-like Zn-dependent dehydrogenase
MQVKAAILEGPKKIRIGYFPKPGLEEKASLLKVEATGICGTDLHRYRGLDTVAFPVIPGHECVGILEEMGAKADRKDDSGATICEGDRVALVPCSPCGECHYCRLMPSRRNLCTGLWTCYGSISCANPPHLFGGFAEYLYLRPGSHMFKIPETLPSDIAALADPMSCVLWGMERIFGVRDGLGLERCVVIQGAGPTGLMYALLSEAIGASKIILIERNPYRVMKAKELGFKVLDATGTSVQERIDEIRQLTDSRGADIVIESTGVPELVGEGLEMARKGGKYLIFGTAVDKGPAPVNPFLICRKELEIYGSYAYPSWKLKSALTALNDMKDQCRNLITHKFPIEKLEEGIMIASVGESLKVVIEPRA